jgi:hypothetical protein
MSNDTESPKPEAAPIAHRLSKQQLRADVLTEHYKLNEEYPGIRANARLISERLCIDNRLALGAGLYLIDKGFLDPGDDGIVHELGNPGVFDYRARITDHGIDFVEDPTAWLERDVPRALVYIVAGGDVSGVTVAARDLQAVSGDGPGVVSQGNAVTNT